MPQLSTFDIDQLFEGSLQRLRAEAKYFSRLTDHKPELGRLNETHLVKLLRDYLPPKIGIGTGFIVSGGEDPQQSPQCDIVLFDALNNAPLYKSDAWSIYPIEMVYGIIEVKTKLDTKQLEDTFEKCAKIRAMATDPGGVGNKRYLRQIEPEPEMSARHRQLSSNLPPRFFVFGYDGWKSMRGLERNFKTLSDQHTKAHIHGVCNLFEFGSLYIRHNAFKKGDERFSSSNINGFRYFLMSLSVTLNSMLSADRIGLCFDQLYLEHYGLHMG